MYDKIKIGYLLTFRLAALKSHCVDFEVEEVEPVEPTTC